MSSSTNEEEPSLSSMVALLDAKINKHLESQALNPFSNDTNVKGLPKRKFSKEEYGRPVKGSLSEARGKRAHQHISREVLELCEIINDHGERFIKPNGKANDSMVVISFGELFRIYTTISNKLVGMLLRARKHKMIDFEGEMLFQRRDDDVPIILLQPIQEIRQMFGEMPDPLEKLNEELEKL